MARVLHAQARQAKVKPAFSLRPVTRSVKRTIAVKDDSGFTTKVVEENESGYMLTTLRGDSAYVTLDDLRRMGYDKDVPLLLEGSDEVVGDLPSILPPVDDDTSGDAPAEAENELEAA